jgi:hypothetical protein
VTVTGQEQAKYLKSGDYVSITSGKYFYIGPADKEENKASGYYYLVEAGDAFFAVQSRKNLAEKDGAGQRVPLEFKGIAREDLNRKENISALLKMKISRNTIDRQLSQYMILEENANPAIWGIAVLFIALLIFVRGPFGGLSNNRKNHERLEKYIGITAAEHAFDSEFNTRDNYMKAGNLHITQNWIFSSETGNTFLMPVSEIVWVYKTAARKKQGRTYKMTMIFSDGSRSELRMNGENCRDAMEALSSRSKNIIIGFSDKLMYSWEADGKSFIEEWNARRGQI